MTIRAIWAFLTPRAVTGGGASELCGERQLCCVGAGKPRNLSLILYQLLFGRDFFIIFSTITLKMKRRSLDFTLFYLTSSSWADHFPRPSTARSAPARPAPHAPCSEPAAARRAVPAGLANRQETGGAPLRINEHPTRAADEPQRPVCALISSREAKAGNSLHSRENQCMLEKLHLVVGCQH